ncbi:hypothetical protein PV327_002156 [Microctonus hyperodae]|uniref:Uncharacterized protein n=1 Tax=Microctonus hyperodae TaxID=165561 RepID=A0AA39KNW0_MICHY|nr:hypothetical protein PV327_002156 [Microctonus hyperodae]
MRLIIALVLVSAFMVVGNAQESDPDVPPLKIDKNLRRALLKALENLETESVENSDDDQPSTEKVVEELTSSSSSLLSEIEQSTIQDIDRFKGASITFDQFNNDSDEVPGEDKLQNTTFVESDKYMMADSNAPTISEISNMSEKVVFQKYDALLGDKKPIEKFSETLQSDRIESRSVMSNKSGVTVNTIDNNLKPTSHERESLAISSSNGIVSASANSLSSPTPTVPSPTVRTVTKNITAPFSPTVSSPTTVKPAKSEVNIFKAPLVAAFTVQQDESGVAKSVVPIYKPNGNGQALTIQEQLEFKQQLLEKQLAELQAQQIQQTEFLIRQQQLYQEQQRQKQRQQYFLQEQTRLKQLEDQRNIQKQQQHQQHLTQQLPLQQPLGAFTQNNLQTLQLPLKSSNLQFQPSVEFQVPNTDVPAPFQPSTHDQFRFQHQRQHLINQQKFQQQQQQQELQQQQQHRIQQQQKLQQQQQQQKLQQQQILQRQQQQQLQLQRLQLLQKEQRLQQSFPTFPIEFQPSVVSSPPRFHRQEAFGTIGNAGINSNSQLGNNQLTLDVPRGPIQSFTSLNQFQQFSPIRSQPQRPPTPANQIQQLLFQSGVARDLGNNIGNGNNQEDLNIVSKVLALNVGALPITQNLKYTNNGFGRV